MIFNQTNNNAGSVWNNAGAAKRVVSPKTVTVLTEQINVFADVWDLQEPADGSLCLTLVSGERMRFNANCWKWFTVKDQEKKGT